MLLALIETRAARATRPTASSRSSPSAPSTTASPLRELLERDPRTQALDLDAIFDYGHYVRNAREIVARLDAIA